MAEYGSLDDVETGLEDAGIPDKLAKELADLAGDSAGDDTPNVVSVGKNDEAPEDADVIVRDNGDGTKTIEVKGQEGKVHVGSDGNDKVKKTTGDDESFGGDGDDTVLGGGGDDTTRGGEGDDLLRGGKGEDKAVGGSGDDTLRGGKDNDTLIGGEGADSLNGGKGADLFFADSGDTVRGGQGEDTAILKGSSDDATIETDPSGFTIVTFADGSTVTLKGVENIEFEDDA